MRKLSERAARQKAAQQHGPENNHFDNLMESDEEDSDDGRTLMTGATGLTKLTGRTGRSVRSVAMDKSVGKRSVVASTGVTSRTRHAAPRLRAEANGDVMDMLDPNMAKCVHFADDVSNDSDSDAGVMEFDEMGRLVVPDDSEVAFGDGDEGVANNEDDQDEFAVPSKRQRVSKFESAKAARDQVHKQKSKNKQVQPLGAAYKSRKAGGDVKKNGQKYEPYAYVPLDGKSYTKKNRSDTVERMSTVVKGGKRKRQN
jgi:ribosomal RNA-processing protein 12